MALWKQLIWCINGYKVYCYLGSVLTLWASQSRFRRRCYCL